MVWAVDGVMVWLLRGVQVAGIVLTVVSARAIDVLELAGVREPDPARPVEFITRGPYGVVRHPIYSGWFAMVFADPVMTGTRLTFAIVSGLYLLIAIPLEERSLRASTGDAYDRYRRVVRWRVLPGLY
jgi:protein-S-isoprenylcysteine O-methyltransferase Ste14